VEPTIYTVGHGTSRFDPLAELLGDHGIATIVDVRSQPYSRHAPDFTKRRLEELCAAAGIGYRWMGDHLGGRPADPSLLGPDGTPDARAMTRDPGFRAALDTVAALAAGARVALLCAEESPSGCHRSTLLAPALIDRGCRVVHLSHDGSAAPHQERLDLR
jgi:uncharacterized protein (DUF488 family)